MKQLYVFVFILLSGLGFGQTFSLEHHYAEGIAQRVNLEYSGEKYVVLDPQFSKVNLYNPDHSLWKSVQLYPPAGTNAHYLYHISEGLIDPDPALEISYAFLSNTTNPMSKSTIVKEDGTVLMAPTYNSFTFSTDHGLEPKLIIRWAETHIKIYRLQGLVLENSFTGYLNRVRFEISGEKFYQPFAMPSGSAKFLNPDLSVWKTIPLPVPENIDAIGVQFYSEKEVDDDPLMEIGYHYLDPQTNTYVGKVINENGAVLLTIPTSGYMYVDKREGLPNKLMVETSFGDGQYQTAVYSLETLSLEHTYPAHVRRVKLEHSGEKYFLQRVDGTLPESNVVEIYNADHTLWKTIALPVPTPAHYVQYVESISQTLFVADAQVEVSYRCDESPPQEIYGSHACVANESQSMLLDVPQAYEILVDQTVGFEPKIFARLYIPTWPSAVNADFETQIYKIDNTTGICGQDSHLVLYPNPASESLAISNDCPIVKVEIYAVTGELVQSESAQMLENLDIGKLASGLYLLRLTNNTGGQLTRKLMVVH